MAGFLHRLVNLEDILEIAQPGGLVFVLTLALLLFFARIVFDFVTDFSLNQELTESDNKALAVSFGGYLLGVCIVILGVYDSGGIEGEGIIGLLWDTLDTVVWGISGIILLLLARIINDRLIMHSFDNYKEIITDRNVGAGVGEAGAYIGSALILYSVMQGVEETPLLEAAGTLLFFLIGQLLFVLFGLVYQWISAFDLQKELREDNAAAGIGLGLSLVAFANIISGYIARYDSLIGLGIWTFFGLIVLSLLRVFVDKLILPGVSLDKEISEDRNWGAALIEGIVALGMSFILNSQFL